MALAVERALELLVRAREGGVVPVEAAAALGRAHEERHEHAAVDGAPLVPHLSLVRVGEDPRRRLAQQVGDRVLDVDPREEPLGPRLDEAAHERPVLVERRPAVRAVLLEREGEVDAVLEIPREDGEGAEAEAAERVVEVRRAHPSSPTTAEPPPTWQPGHQYAVRAFSPCGAERTMPPQRGQARPARR